MCAGPRLAAPLVPAVIVRYTISDARTFQLEAIVKVAYVSQYDHSDISRWSGSVYHMAKCITDSGLSLDYISGLSSPWELVYLAKAVLYRKVLRKPYARHYEPAVLHAYSGQVERQLHCLRPEVVFSPGTIPIAYLQTDKPIVFWTDATYAGMVNFYPEFTNLCREGTRKGHQMEQAALSRYRLAIYCSEWAARTAIDYYDVDPHKVKVVPFGANIECYRNIEDIRLIIANRDAAVCQLLFVGVDWLRKGGDIALAVATALNAHGLPTELHVVGCTPPIHTPDFVKLHGFVSKKSPEGRMLLNQLFTQSHYVILPTRADCFGVVFAEASSFGLPSLTTQVGGVPTAVADNQNGQTFLLDGIVEHMTAYILNAMADSCIYNALCIASFNEYWNRLNWMTAGNTVNRLLHEFC